MATRTGKRLPMSMAETAMERAALKWANRIGADYQDGWRGAMKDLFYGGCASGMVSELIYYTDTERFYKRHGAEIDALLAEHLGEFGTTPAALFKGAGWDESDPMARETCNRNILAWFGFEEAARRVASRAGYDD